MGGADHVIAGEFDSYPMWFAAVSDVPAEDVQVVSVFARESTTDPWLLVQAPRLATTTELPEARVATESLRLATATHRCRAGSRPTSLQRGTPTSFRTLRRSTTSTSPTIPS